MRYKFMINNEATLFQVFHNLKLTINFLKIKCENIYINIIMAFIMRRWRF